MTRSAVKNRSKTSVYDTRVAPLAEKLANPSLTKITPTFGAVTIDCMSFAFPDGDVSVPASAPHFIISGQIAIRVSQTAIRVKSAANSSQSMTAGGDPAMAAPHLQNLPFAKRESGKKRGRRSIGVLSTLEKKVQNAWKTGSYKTYIGCDTELRLEHGTTKRTLDAIRQREKRREG